MIVELRDRFDDDNLRPQAQAAQGLSGGDGRDAENALVSLGYSRQQAARLVARVKREHPAVAGADELIRLALQSLAAPGAGARP